MSFKDGEVVMVAHPFKGQKDEDLPCTKGERLTIKKVISDDNWLFCSNKKGNTGLVPVNHIKYINLEINEKWFRGNITRKEVEKLLKDSSDGSFLVRTSEKYPGDYTLCVSYEKTIQFYHVLSFDQGFTLDEESYFADMTELINHYQRDADGLVCKLNRCDSVDIDGTIIEAKDLEFGQKIGCGEFSEVFQGKYKNETVAIKQFKRTLFSNKLFLYEATLMEKLQHPNLVRFIDTSSVGIYVCIITEFMENGSLVNYLRSRGRSVIKHADQLKFAIGACKGMTYLEEHCLVHRDLAARNILLSSELEAKVSDFGLAKQADDHGTAKDEKRHQGSEHKKDCHHILSVKDGLEKITLTENQNSNNNNSTNNNNSGGGIDNDSTNVNRIPVKWTAPEALSDNIYTNKSDVWSFGILLWEIYSFGRTPYPRIFANNVKEYLLHGNRMDSPEGTPASMYELMRQCWHLEPDKRPNFIKILEILQLRQKELSK